MGIGLLGLMASLSVGCYVAPEAPSVVDTAVPGVGATGTDLGDVAAAHAVAGAESAGVAFGGVGSVPPQWTHFEINSSVHAVAFQGGDVWVGTEGGLLRYDLRHDRVVAKYGASSPLLSDTVMSLDLAPDGGLWVGTHGGGLTHVSDSGQWTRYSVPDLGDPFVYGTLADIQGNGYWVATWSGLSHFDGTGWRTYTTADGLADDWVYAMVQEADGTLWLGTEGGVSAFANGRWTTYTHRDGLGAKAAVVGEYEVLGNPSRHHRETPGKRADGYNPNYVLSALIDRDGHKWFGTWGGGLSRFDGKRWRTYTHADGLAGNFVTDLLQDADGALWATTDGGVSVLRDGRWARYREADGLLSDAVFTVAVDPQGRKWFGAMGGLSRLDLPAVAGAKAPGAGVGA